jgi:hypothetical protein
MRIIVNDANILIDLVELGIPGEFFALDFDFRTHQGVLNELFDYQLQALEPFIASGKLLVERPEEEELMEAAKLATSRNGLSLNDCAAFLQALKHKAILLTSDNKLRKHCMNHHTETHGHLWVFNLMVEHKLLNGKTAILKLSELCEKVNPRLGLPGKECRKMEEAWKQYY